MKYHYRVRQSIINELGEGGYTYYNNIEYTNLNEVKKVFNKIWW